MTDSRKEQQPPIAMAIASRLPTTAPSSPGLGYEDEDLDREFLSMEDQLLYEEEKKARLANEKAEERKKAAYVKKRIKEDRSKEEQETKSLKLDELLAKSEAFSKRLQGKTDVLGKVGTSLDGQALGDHNLTMATQPKSMIGGTMRSYQLEGLTWMIEVCQQGMSGILADEMGLGKTIQTISLIAHLREVEGYLGPHLIIAPLSTLSNWIEEFQKWTPDVPVVLYHGTKAERREIFNNKISKNYKKGRPSKAFPVVCTSPEMVMMDSADLTKINWEFIIIDEGHRMKNSESKLFRILKEFTSATRLLITGTPLQNNLKELWSLLNFLLPAIFTHWEQFDDWFDFSDLQDEEGTAQFIQDKKKKELVRKLRVVLQPLLLRRVKADVEHLLPKKREYILYAPMTREQTQLYNAITDKAVDTRKFLEDRVVERLTAAASKPKPGSTPNTKAKSKPKELPKTMMRSTKKQVDTDSDSEDDVPLALRPRVPPKDAPKNAFQQMMQRKSASSSRASSVSSLKRKSNDPTSTPVSKSVKSSKQSTPTRSIRSVRTRGRNNKMETYSSDEDNLSDDEFEQKLANEAARKEELKKEGRGETRSEDEIALANMVELARKEIAGKKLGNPTMQLRLTCNSPHNFFNPWSTGIPADESLVTLSGKMLLLDRLLKSLFARGSKVLVFSQFKIQLDLLEDYARDLRKWNVCRIDGSIKQDDRRLQIKQFNEDPEFKLFLLSTRAGGQGINLASADTVILFDSDWNPQQDLQAQDRAHRIGQKNPVIIFRLTTKDTVEESLLHAAEGKRRLEKAVIEKTEFKDKGRTTTVSGEAGKIQLELKDLLLKDGMIFKGTGNKKEEILSDADLDTLCDRSDAAYERAAKGEGDAENFKVIETKYDGIASMITADEAGSAMEE